jgi:hypothetical protein
VAGASHRCASRLRSGSKRVMAETDQTAQPTLPSNVDDPRFVAPPEDVAPLEWTASDAVLAGLGDPVSAFKDTVRTDLRYRFTASDVLWVVAQFVNLVRKMSTFLRHGERDDQG